eukprot:6174911-Pleurochrysis_carterae.AAC.1
MRAATAREATEEKARAEAPASLLRLPSGKRARSEGSMAGPGAAEAEESEFTRKLPLAPGSNTREMRELRQEAARAARNEMLGATARSTSIRGGVRAACELRQLALFQCDFKRTAALREAHEVILACEKEIVKLRLDLAAAQSLWNAKGDTLPKFHTLRHRALRRRRRAAGGREEASAAEARHLRADSAERQKAEEIAQCMREEAERQAEAAKAAQASADNAIERARKEHEEQCSEQGFDG